MSPTFRRAAARALALGAALVVVLTVVQYVDKKAAGDLDVQLDVDAVPGVRVAHLELRRGTKVIAWADRDYDDDLPGRLHLRCPPLGKDGVVRVRLETDRGLRQFTRPLVAPGGSTVVIRAGVAPGE